MKRVLRQVVVGAIAALAISAGAARVEAATITVGLVPVSSQEATANSVLVQRATWGNVMYNGMLVGTYVMRQEFAMAGNSNTTTPYPTPLVTITVRLDPPFGSRTDTLILQGTHPGVAVPGNITIIGSVTAATGSIAFLRGAQWTTAVGVGDVPLTFTY